MEGNSEKGKWAVLTSTFTLIICFILTYIFYQYLIAYFARGLDYEAGFSFNEVYLPWDSSLWTRTNVTHVNFYPHIFCFLAGLGGYYVLKKNKDELRNLRLPLFWLSVCLLNITMSQLAYAALGIGDTFSVFYYGLARVATWHGIPFAFQLIFSVIGWVAFMFFGFYLCKLVVGFSPSYSLVEKRPGKNLMVVKMYVLPVLLAFTPLLMLGTELRTLRLLMMLIGLLVPAIGMFTRNARANYQVNFKKAGIGDSFPKIGLVLSMALWGLVFFWLK